MSVLPIPNFEFSESLLFFKEIPDDFFCKVFSYIGIDYSVLILNNQKVLSRTGSANSY